MKHLLLLTCLTLGACSSGPKAPVDQATAEKTSENLKFPPDFYAKPDKVEKPELTLPKT